MENRVNNQQGKKNFTFIINRYDPTKSSGLYQSEYKIELPSGTTVLDALIKIKEEQDNTLSFRYSCRMGVCGSCGMFINGLPVLACQTQVYELESDIIEVKPLPNYDILRDLASDLAPLFQKHRSVLPWIIRKDIGELDNPTGEFIQSPENLDWIYQFTYCLKCGLCLSACPTASSDSLFLGPQALSQAYRYSMDVRDEGFDKRIEIVDQSHGCWRCHYASSCSQVCPKGVDPARGIQLLKKEIILRKLRLKESKRGSEVATEPVKGEKLKDIPSPPPKIC